MRLDRLNNITIIDRDIHYETREEETQKQITGTYQMSQEMRAARTDKGTACRKRKRIKKEKK